ncbi:ABC transporter permease [Bifidobacterium dentium]|uniref:ABC transporter permease n=1 Tax=Bifidobacterium dentium TaxID=1689 RepID=UPI0018B0CBE2|nr:ABC transporter permease [Bifidobacterium dentium]MBF9693760.1 ABC transporter permease [Bifidobacterium dentium]
MRFLGKRLLLFVGALVGLSLLVFALLRILPGDVAAVVAGTNATAERLTSLRAQMGLDKSYAAQYGDWVLGLLHGDLGTSVVSGKAVSAQVSSRASVTFPLIVLSLLIALAIGLPLGCAAVLTRNVRLRGVFHAAAIVAGAIPALWGGLLLILLFSKGIGLMGLLPSQGFPDAGWAAPLSAMAALVLPALATGITAGASIMRYTRAAVGDMASSQAVAMAMACGMTRRQAVLRVALRLAIPQLVSVIGLTFAQMVTGVMVVENLFALPGLGSMLVTDVGNRDLTAVQSELFLLAAFFLFLGLLIDLLHRMLDPRLKNATIGSGEVLS